MKRAPALHRTDVRVAATCGLTGRLAGLVPGVKGQSRAAGGRVGSGRVRHADDPARPRYSRV